MLSPILLPDEGMLSFGYCVNNSRLTAGIKYTISVGTFQPLILGHQIGTELGHHLVQVTLIHIPKLMYCAAMFNGHVAMNVPVGCW